MRKTEAKERLDLIIQKSRVDLYKPIQVAETLRRARLHSDVDFDDLGSYKNPSLRWRDEVSIRLLGKKSTSSAQFQHNVWNQNAFHQDVMKALDEENRRTHGEVEKYIYLRFQERQETVGTVITYINQHSKDSFHLEELLELFIHSAGIKRSVDKAYEIVTHSILEIVVSGLQATVIVQISDKKHELVEEFEDLTKALLGIDRNNLTKEIEAHVYRVGVTNAADRGLDMWANFGPAVQVKHLTLDATIANTIVDQIESDHIVVVCKESEREVLEIVTSQIGWGQRIRGIITENDLISWYEKCLRGQFSSELGENLLNTLKSGFLAEFPHNTELQSFMAERNYDQESNDDFWKLD